MPDFPDSSACFLAKDGFHVTVLEKFFSHFRKNPTDFCRLERLNPSYRIVYGTDDMLDVPADFEGLCAMAERLESGSSKNLSKFLEAGKYKYDIGVRKLVYKPGLSITELLDIEVIKNFFRLNLFDSISEHIRKNFKNPRLIQMLEFPVLFLGGRPEKTRREGTY